METGLALSVAVISLQVIATVVIAVSKKLTTTHRLLSLLLAWQVPVLGAIAVFMVVSDLPPLRGEPVHSADVDP